MQLPYMYDQWQLTYLAKSSPTSNIPNRSSYFGTLQVGQEILQKLIIKYIYFEKGHIQLGILLITKERRDFSSMTFPAQLHRGWSRVEYVGVFHPTNKKKASSTAYPEIKQSCPGLGMKWFPGCWCPALHRLQSLFEVKDFHLQLGMQIM